MGSSGFDADGADSVGSAAEEAARLLGALSDWAKERGPELGAGLAGMASHAAAGIGGAFAEHIDTGAPECDWCPVCRTVHLVRQSTPEVRDHLVQAATSLLQATLSMMGSIDSGSGSGGAPRQAKVQNIDLSGSDDWPSA